MLLLVADLQELKANPKKPAAGHGARRRGSTRAADRWPPSSSRTARLKVGDTVVAGRGHGQKVRALIDDQGERLKSARVLRRRSRSSASQRCPSPGDQLLVVTDSLEGAVHRRVPPAEAPREGHGQPPSKIQLEDPGRAIAEGQLAGAALVVKADVQGSVEAVTRPAHEAAAGQRSSCAIDPLGRGRHHRGRRAPGRRLQRRRHRLQRPAGAQGRGRGRARQGRGPPLHRHLRRGRRTSRRRWKACSSRPSARCGWARPRCATPSSISKVGTIAGSLRDRRQGQPPAPRCACCATTS